MSRKRRITADEKNVAAGGKKTFGPIFKIVIAAAAIVVGSLVPIVAGQGVFAGGADGSVGLVAAIVIRKFTDA